MMTGARGEGKIAFQWESLKRNDDIYYLRGQSKLLEVLFGSQRCFTVNSE